MQMLPVALDAGLSIDSFWNSTLDELFAVIDCYKRREKASIAQSYLAAKMIAQFVGISMNGKSIPEIHQMFPELFIDEANKAASEQQMLFIKERFKVFADQRKVYVGGINSGS